MFKTYQFGFIGLKFWTAVVFEWKPVNILATLQICLIVTTQYLRFE